MPGLKLFHTTESGMTEVMPRLAEAEADVQRLVEAHMETLLGVRLLASEYVLDCLDGGRIDSLGLDENNAPVIVEYKRGTDAGAINQGLYYMAWLMCHRGAFRRLVRDRLGASAASRILWSAPRLICVAGDFTRYDAHAVREHRHNIDLVRTGTSAASTSAWRPWPRSPVFRASASGAGDARPGPLPAGGRAARWPGWPRRSTGHCSVWETVSPGSGVGSTPPTGGCGTSPASARRSGPSSSST